jgi:O-antigen ligase
MERLNIGAPYPFNQFHNVYLEMAVQFGIPGILLLLLLLGWIGWMGIRKMDYLLLSLLVIYLFFFWTESVLFFSSVTPFAFWVCFLVATQKVRVHEAVIQ